jgi:hypothetical protein
MAMNIAIPPLRTAEQFERETERELAGPTPQLEVFDVGDEDGNIPPRNGSLARPSVAATCPA